MMYVKVRQKKLKKVGYIYKEEVEEKVFKVVRKVITTASVVLITHLETVCSGLEKEYESSEAVWTTDCISTKELVGMEIYE